MNGTWRMGQEEEEEEENGSVYVGDWDKGGSWRRSGEGKRNILGVLVAEIYRQTESGCRREFEYWMNGDVVCGMWDMGCGMWEVVCMWSVKVELT